MDQFRRRVSLHVSRLRAGPALALVALLLVGAGEGEGARLDALIEAQDKIWLEAHPDQATQAGLKIGYDRWSPAGDEGDALDRKLYQQQLAALKAVDPSKLDEERNRSYRLFERRAREQLARLAFVGPRWALTQQSGPHTQAPSLLITSHRIDSVADAQAYIARLRALPVLLDQAVSAMEKRTPLPRFMYATILDTARKLADGAPLRQDFRDKLARLQIDDAEKARLTADADAAIAQSVGPAYRAFEQRVAAAQGKASGDTGMSAIPQGAAYYALLLQQTTTKDDATAHDIHELGLKEVARIHGEIRALMPALGAKTGDLKSFLEQRRRSEGSDYSNDEAGRAKYLDEARAVVANVKQELPKLFHTLPKADVEVRRVEPFREQGAATAFYVAPSLDGTRPGIVYVNLRNMNELGRAQLEGLLYHEAIPGHHMQNAIAIERADLPRFRKRYWSVAYGEGWALYCEKLMKELGFYKDPESDFGRLNNELLRAMRLVLDTGVHSEGWSRERALAWFVEVSAFPAGRAQLEVDRYYANPGQAVGYKIGELEIFRIRERAKAALGPKFDLARFHDRVLQGGALPLPMLAEAIDNWVAAGGA